MKFKSTSMQDLQTLAHHIRDIPVEKHIEFASLVMYTDLLLPPLWIRIAVRILRWLKKADKHDIYKEIFSKQPDVATQTLDLTIQHMLNGKDKWSKDSAGGYSQIEIDRLVVCIYGATGWKSFEEQAEKILAEC